MAAGGSKIDWGQEAVPRERVLFFLFLGVIVYLFYSLVWSRAESAAKETAKQTKVLTAQIASMEQLLDATKKQAEQPKVEQPEVVPGAPKEDPRFAPYLRGELKRSEEVLEEMVKNLTNPLILRGVELASFSMDKAIDGGTYLRVPFTLQVEGPFAATMLYLQHIEELPLLVVFDDLEVVSPAKQRMQLMTTLRSTLYVVKSAAALTAPLDPTGKPPATPAK